jgi:hypothetical protein
VDLVTVAFLREQVQRLDERYDQVPSALLLAETGHLYGRVVLLRRHAIAGRLQRELAAGIAESAILMGQLVWDASQRRESAASNAYFDEAIGAAQETRDVVTEAHAVLRKSYVALYGTRDPVAGLALASRAAATSATASHVITGLALLHAGEAFAMLGDVKGCTSALETAEDRLANVGAGDPAGLLFCPSQYGRLAGSCQLHLGRPDKAEAVLEASGQHLQGNRKANAIVLGNLAIASVQQRHIDTAAARLHDAIDVIEQTRSGGGLNVVFTAVRELRPWRNEPVVQEVTDRLLTLMTAA